MSELALLRRDLQNLADTLAPLLGVEIGFIDGGYENIAATGPFRAELGTHYPRPSLTALIMESQRDLFMERPRATQACSQCPRRNNCRIMATLCVPIKCRASIVGLWAFIAYNEAQREALYQRRAMLWQMSQQVIRMLECYLRQHQAERERARLLHYLQRVLDGIPRGMMIVDRPASLILANKLAKEQVGRALGSLGHRLFSRSLLPQTGDSVTSYSFREVIGRRFVAGTVQPLIEGGEPQGAIITFEAFGGEEAGAEDALAEIVGRSEAILKLKETIRTLAPTEATVLLTGESGTGKELLARAIHRLSRRKAGPFVAVNCAAIPADLLEAELFGYEKGAFTGARPEGKAGIFELAQGGTILLDEVGDLPLSLQAKLLRVIEDRQIQRVGGLRSIPLDVRFLAATNRDLAELVAQGRFREDLYWRLNVVLLSIPPLRERPEDIMPLARFFLRKYAHALGKHLGGFAPDCEDVLSRYPWPGNVRELQNVVHCAAIMERSSFVTVRSVPERLTQGEGTALAPRLHLEELEKEAIARALAKFGWNKKGKEAAARELGIGIASLYRKIKKYGLEGGRHR
ncbi:MAG: sigma 54-interacting transcriptional regulator [Clostridia bacterium]|nr:sigma 54-interacting transcriptional regulator [Clostridia bacterium]